MSRSSLLVPAVGFSHSPWFWGKKKRSRSRKRRSPNSTAFARNARKTRSHPPRLYFVFDDDEIILSFNIFPSMRACKFLLADRSHVILAHTPVVLQMLESRCKPGIFGPLLRYTSVQNDRKLLLESERS